MISLICEILNKAQMNLSMKQQQYHGHENRLVLAKREGAGGGWIGRLGVADVSFYI